MMTKTLDPHDVTLSPGDIELLTLPPGWARQYDTAHRRPYYVDRGRNISTWEHPIVTEAKRHAVQSVLPAGWTSETDAEGGTYYCHLDTGVSTWDHPNLKHIAQELVEQYARRDPRPGEGMLEAAPTPILEMSLAKQPTSPTTGHSIQLQSPTPAPIVHARTANDAYSAMLQTETSQRSRGIRMTRDQRSYKEYLREMKGKARLEEADMISGNALGTGPMPQPQQPSGGRLVTRGGVPAAEQTPLLAVEEDPLHEVSLDNLQHKMEIGIRQSRKRLYMPELKFCEELSRIMHDVMIGRTAQLRMPDLFAKVGTKRIVYENWQPRDVVDAVMKNEFALCIVDPQKLDLHLAVAVHLDITVSSAVITVMLGQCWRNENQYATAQFRERRQKRRDETGTPIIPLTWENFDDVLQEEATYLRTQGGMETVWPASLKLNLFNCVERDEELQCELLTGLTQQRIDVLNFTTESVEAAMVACLLSPVLRLHEHPDEGIDNLRFGCVRLPHYSGHSQDSRPVQTIRLCAQWKGAETVSPLPRLPGVDYLSSPQLPVVPLEPGRILMGTKKAVAEESITLTDRFGASNGAAPASPVRSLATTLGGDTPAMTSQDYLPTYSNSAITPQRDVDDIARRSQEVSQQLEREMADWQAKLLRLNWRFSAENEPYSPTRPAQDSAVAPPAVGRSAPASAASTANTGREPRTPISDSRRMMPQEQFSSPPNLAASPPPIETPVPVNDTSLLQYVAKLKAAFDECATDPHEMPRYDEMEMLRKQVADQNQANHLLLLQVKDLNTKAANDQLGQLSDGGTALEVPLTPNVADRARPAFNVDREEAMLSAEFKELRPTYSVLLYTLQRSPIYLAQLLAACTADQQAEIMPTITHCLLGHYSLDESYLIEFVAQTIRDHFRQRQLQSLRSPDIVPTDSLLYRVLMAIAAREDCVLYARRTLQKIMYDLVGANALDFEVDIDRLLVAAVGSIEQLHKLVESRLPLLHGSIEGVCDSLLEEGPVQAIPDVISRTVRLLSAEAEGYSEGSGARAFTEFFWDIFLLPCLGAPESHGVIEPFTAMTPVLRRNLAIIQLIMFYFTRPITPFRSPVRASATAQVAAASQDLPDVQIDIRAGPVEDQQAVLELLNHEFKPLYQHYVRHFTEYRNRVMRPQSPRKKRRPVYDETFARETSDIIAVSVSEISLLHSVLLQQTRLHSTPPIIPPLLKQLGAPIAVHSRDEDSLILQKLRPVEESPAVLPTENANEINQIARKQLFEVKAAIADLGSLDQGYAASLLTGLERVKPYVVNWNKTRRALTRGNELLKRYNSEIAETLRIMKRSLQKAVISRMQHTADTTSLLTPFGRSASRGGFSNRLPEPMSPDTPPPQSALSNASRPTAASLLAKAAADRERKVIADADRVKMEQAQQRQQAEQLLQRQQSVSALASDRRATAQFMPVQPLHTVPSQQAAFQPPLVPQLPLGASAYQRNEQYYKHDEHPPQVPQRPEDVSPSQYQYQQQAAEPHVDEHDHAGEDQIDGDEEWVMDNPLFGAVRQGHRLPQYPPTDWYGDWQRYQEEERQLRESQQQADAGEQAHQQVPQYVPDTEQSQQSFVPSPQYAHQLLPQQSHHQQQHQFVKPPTPQPQSQAQLDPHSMQPVPRRSQATLNAANLANPTAAVDPTQWEREQWIRQQQQQPPSPQVLSSELHDMQQREAQLELRRRNSHMQQVQLQAEVEQRRQAEMAEEKRRLDEAESTFTVTNPLQAAGRRVKQLVAVPTYTAPLVPPASPVQLSTYSAVPAASPPFISLSQQQQQQQQPVYRASLQDPGAPLAVPAATAAPRFPASQTPTEVPASARYASTLSRMASVRSSERFTLPPPASSPPQRSQSQAITPDVPGSPQSQTQRAPPSPILKKPQTLASPKSRASAKLLAGLGPESAKHMPKPHELATTANYLARKQAVSGTGRASSRTSSPHSNGASTTPTQQRTHFDNAGPVHPPPARSQQDAAALAKPYTPLSQQQPIPSGQPYSGRASFSQQPMPLAQQLQQQSQAPLPFTPSPQLTPAAAPLSHMTTLPFQQAFPLQHQSPSTQSNLSALMPQRYGSPQAGYPRPY